MCGERDSHTETSTLSQPVITKNEKKLMELWMEWRVRSKWVVWARVQALSPGIRSADNKNKCYLSSAQGNGDIWRQEPIIVLLERFGIAINLEYWDKAQAARGLPTAHPSHKQYQILQASGNIIFDSSFSLCGPRHNSYINIEFGKVLLSNLLCFTVLSTGARYLFCHF